MSTCNGRRRDYSLGGLQPQALAPRCGDRLGVRAVVRDPGRGAPVVGIALVTDSGDLAQDLDVQRIRNGIGGHQLSPPVINGRV